MTKLLIRTEQQSPPAPPHTTTTHHHVPSKMETCFRFCDSRSTSITIALTGLSMLMFSIQTWQSNVTVTAKLASLATMVAVCIPLTYLPLAELHAHVQMQRRGVVRSARVMDHLVNPSGFARWRLEIDVPEGTIRKWVHSSAKLALGSVVDVTITDDWIYCRVENSNRPMWRTTAYLATLILVSVTDTIESLYFVLFGIIEAVNLLREEGCSLVNIGVHLLFAVIFGGAVCAICHSCFWKRRYADLPSAYGYEFIMPCRHHHRLKIKGNIDDDLKSSLLLAYPQIV